MFTFFKGLSSMFIIIGIILIGLSLFGSVSIWFGIELIKGGIFVFIFAVFMELLEQTFKQSEKGSANQV